MKNYESMCNECAELRKIKGVWCCHECFDQHCDDLDECPLGLTTETVEEAQTLDAEQQAVEKKMRNSDTHEKVKAKRERKPNEDKRVIIQQIMDTLAPICDTTIEIVNAEREICFSYSGKRYRITLACPRK